MIFRKDLTVEIHDTYFIAPDCVKIIDHRTVPQPKPVRKVVPGDKVRYKGKIWISDHFGKLGDIILISRKCKHCDAAVTVNTNEWRFINESKRSRSNKR